MTTKLSAAQVRALRAIERAQREKKPVYHFIASPWPTMTLRSLERLGLIVRYTLTDAGRAVLAELDAADHELTQSEVIATFRSKSEAQA